MRLLAAAISGSGIGTALISACVYGCSMLEYSSCTGARSTMQPRYITPTLWEMWRTMERSWETNRYESPSFS